MLQTFKAENLTLRTLRAENVRLRAELASATRRNKQLLADKASLQASVHRLKTANDSMWEYVLVMARPGYEGEEPE